MSGNSVRTNLTIAILTTCTLTIAAGWVEGRISNRWGQSVDLGSAAKRLAVVPDRVAEWDLQLSEPLDEEVVRMLQCAGHFLRVYNNRRTGDVVSVALLVGPPGPTAAHTPEICYSSRGQTIVEPSVATQSRPASDPDETLWRMTFRATDVEQRMQRVFYGWSGPDGRWRAARDPRFEYGGQPLLYKIQVAGLLREKSDKEGDDPCRRFLQDFLPVLDQSLFQESSR